MTISFIYPFLHYYSMPGESSNAINLKEFAKTEVKLSPIFIQEDRFDPNIINETFEKFSQFFENSYYEILSFIYGALTELLSLVKNKLSEREYNSLVKRLEKKFPIIARFFDKRILESFDFFTNLTKFNETFQPPSDVKLILSYAIMRRKYQQQALREVFLEKINNEEFRKLLPNFDIMQLIEHLKLSYSELLESAKIERAVKSEFITCAGCGKELKFEDLKIHWDYIPMCKDCQTLHFFSDSVDKRELKHLLSVKKRIEETKKNEREKYEKIIWGYRRGLLKLSKRINKIERELRKQLTKEEKTLIAERIALIKKEFYENVYFNALKEIYFIAKKQNNEEILKVYESFNIVIEKKKVEKKPDINERNPSVETKNIALTGPPNVQ